jgi:hypothetical protein
MLVTVKPAAKSDRDLDPRYHGSLERWSFAFYSYASCSYEPACFSSGDLIG